MPIFKTRSFASMRRGFSSLFLATSFSIGLVAVTSNSVSAEYDTVTTLTPSNPAAYANRLSDVSCVSTTFCMSVVEGQQTSNFSDPVETFLTKWDGGSWSLVPTSGWPTGFRSSDIACVTTTLCLVTGSYSFYDPSTQTMVNNPYLMLWNGSTVSQVSIPTGISMLNAVSCASATFCLAVGGSTETPKRSLVLRWDGTSVTRDSSSNFSNGTNDQFMMDIDCDTSRRCVGVTSIDLGGGTYSGEILDRGAVAGMWSRLSGRTDSLGQLRSIDCQPGELGLCAVVGSVTGGTSGVLYDLGADMANKFRNVAFPIMPSGGLTNALTGQKLSCVSITRCVLVGDFMVEMPRTESYVGVWDGSAWNRLTSSSAVGGSRIDDISCPTSTQCVSVGSSKATSGMMAPNSAASWFIRDATQVAAPSATTAPATTAPATTAPATTAPSTSAPAPTTVAPATTVAPISNQSSPTTTSLPAPALTVVRALPKATTPIIADASIATGEAITVSFSGFTPFEFVQLIVASTPKVIGSGYADAKGVVTLSGNLPASLASGNHTLAVYAPKSGIGFSQPITVSPLALPATGSGHQAALIALSMLFLLCGVLLRRSHHRI